MKQRTTLQNRALHKYFEMLAATLNEHGLDMKKVLKPHVDIPWNKETVKNYLWRPIQKAQLEKESTTELTTKEIDEVWSTLNRFVSEKFGVHEPFPSVEELMFELRNKDFNPKEYE